MANIYDKGIEGKVGAGGLVTHPGCKAVVVLQRDDMEDPLPMMFAASEADAREYVKAMRSTGQGGLRIVKPTDLV